MLIRNCEKFLRKGDFNIRMTLFGRNPKYFMSGAYYNAWIETIRDSLGGSIINSETYYKFVISRISKDDNVVVTSYDRLGKNFISCIKEVFPSNPESIRIDVYEFKKGSNNLRSWIILIPEFEK